MTTPAPSISEALERLWIKFLPEIERRVAILESSAQALAAGSLSKERREAAHAEAHKLSGTLGMFGLHRGTELARQAEVAFAEALDASAADLSLQIAELRLLIEQRK